MMRFSALLFFGVFACLSTITIGCGGDTTPDDENLAVTAPAEVPKPVETEEQPTAEDEADDKETKTSTLQLKGIAFTVPAGWNQVEADNRIIEAQFSLSAAEEDDTDGRLTLMGAGGNKDDNINRWKGQFEIAAGDEPLIETMSIANQEATWVDLRGTFKGQGGPLSGGSPAQKNFRMLAVIIPFDGNRSYFVKLTGPKTTVGNYEEAFREFVRSAQIK